MKSSSPPLSLVGAGGGGAGGGGGGAGFAQAVNVRIPARKRGSKMGTSFLVVFINALFSPLYIFTVIFTTDFQ